MQNKLRSRQVIILLICLLICLLVLLYFVFKPQI